MRPFVSSVTPATTDTAERAHWSLADAYVSVVT